MSEYAPPLDPAWLAAVAERMAQATARPWYSTWEVAPPAPPDLSPNAIDMLQDLIWSEAGMVFGPGFYDGVYFGGTEADSGLAVLAVNGMENALARLAWLEGELERKAVYINELHRQLDAKEDELCRTMNEGVQTVAGAFIADAQRQVAQAQAEIATLQAKLDTRPRFNAVELERAITRQMHTRQPHADWIMTIPHYPRPLPRPAPTSAATPDACLPAPADDLGSIMLRLDAWAAGDTQRQIQTLMLPGETWFTARLIECDAVLATGTGPTSSAALRSLCAEANL